MEINNIIFEILNETIRKKGNKYCLISGKGKILDATEVNLAQIKEKNKLIILKIK